jgi:catechol 2,3-dioxygenase-like lactoylglutathione lyase family enzyme
MRAVPVLWSGNMQRSLAFYTGVLEFTLRWPQHRELSMSSGVVDIVCAGAVIQLSIHMGANPTASSVNLELERSEDVDAAWARFTSCGLDQSHRVASPVHLGPLDQTWGTREVYVNDPDGNCLCFRAWR